MGARGKEICVVLLDVGPLMGDLLEPAAKAVSAFIQGKMINKPAHELQLVFFGTTGTSNCLNQEMADQGDDSQYTNITEERPMDTPDVAWLQSLANIKPGAEGTPSDWFSALTVGVDALERACAPEEDGGRASQLGKYNRRIVLVSNFQAESPPADDMFIEHVVGKLKGSGEKGAKDTLLDVVSIDVPNDGFDSAAAGIKNTNLNTLAQVLQEVRHKERHIQDPVELRTAFRLKETTPTTLYAGTLDIGSLMKIGVKVVKKVAAEKAPATGKWSDRPQAADASHAVKRDVEYKLVSDPDVVIDGDHKTKAYQYGSQLVPISDDSMLKLPKEQVAQSMQLLGFVDNDPDNPAIPRHHYMKDVLIVVPDKADERSQLAMSAFVAAMVRDSRKLALIRFVPRDKAPPKLHAAAPLPAAPGRPACLVLNELPFQEDIRQFGFQSFDGDEQRLKPTQAQRDIMGDLVRGMDLTKREPELLRPEGTANPSLHRMYDLLAARALDANAPVPDAGPVAARLSAPSLADGLPTAAADALAALPDAFSITERAAVGVGEDGGAAAEGLLGRGDGADFDLDAEAGTAVEAVSTASPVEDFRAMLKNGKHDAAFDGMPHVISALVKKSIGDRYYAKALAALEEMREGAAQHRDFAPAFNAALHSLATDFETDSDHAAWWAKVMGQGVTLLSEEEAPGSGATANDAAKFLKDHSPTAQGTQQTQAPAAGTEEDFDDME